MKVSEFVLRYKKADDNGRQKLVTDHIKHAYVPYETKVAHCELIAQRTVLEGSSVKLNTPARYMLLIVVFIQDHMDLDFSDVDNLAMFNKMEASGADDMICAILTGEFKKYSAVLDMCVDDLIDRKRNYVDYIDRILNGTSEGLQDFMKQLAEAQSEEGSKDE